MTTNNLTLCPVCGQRVDNFNKHYTIKHKDLLELPKVKIKSNSPTRKLIRQHISTQVKIDIPPQVIGSSWECCGQSMRIIDSRKVHDYVLRRKICNQCGNKFSTYEFRISDKDTLR